METQEKPRTYAGCEKLLETWPETKRCDKPVKLTAENKGSAIRCTDHPIKRIWPGEDE
jgi:hypothetical protein